MEAWLAVAGIIAVATFTPGPNNLIVLEAGARGGFSAAVRPASAVIAGSLALLALAWAGAGVLFEAEPRLRSLLALAGSTWLCSLGIRLIRQSVRARQAATAAPAHAGALPRDWAAIVLFQLVNPKAWGLVVTATAAVGGRGWTELALLALLLAALSACGLALWTVAGSLLRNLRDEAMRRFDLVCGIVLVACAATMAAQAFSFSWGATA